MVENGGCAFPHEHFSSALNCSHGMCVRDYMAAHILGSLLNPASVPNIDTAKRAYAWADMMIEARKNGTS